MTEEHNVDMVGESSSMTWRETWKIALNKPSVETFERIIADPNATEKRAYTWIFFTTMIIGSPLFVFFAFTMGSLGGTWGFGTLILFLIVESVVIPFGAVLSIMISAGITQAIAGALGGTGTYAKLVYAFASFLIPLWLMALLTGMIVVVPLFIPFGFYIIWLTTIAVKAVNQLNWGKSFIATLVVDILIIGTITALFTLF